MMNFLGNVIWFLFAGLWQGIGWLVAGLLWSVTIVGIPVGRQCFKLAALWFCPFGRDVEAGGGVRPLGLRRLSAAAINGFLLCLTVVGIPFGMQCFKLARLSLSPFGARIVYR